MSNQLGGPDSRASMQLHAFNAHWGLWGSIQERYLPIPPPCGARQIPATNTHFSHNGLGKGYIPELQAFMSQERTTSPEEESAESQDWRIGNYFCCFSTPRRRKNNEPLTFAVSWASTDWTQLYYKKDCQILDIVKIKMSKIEIGKPNALPPALTCLYPLTNSYFLSFWPIKYNTESILLD